MCRDCPGPSRRKSAESETRSWGCFLRLLGAPSRGRPGRSRSLLRVKLDDELLLHRSGDLGPLREAEDLRGEAVVVGLEPGRHDGGQLCRFADDGLDRRVRSHRDHVLLTQLVRGDVNAPAVDHPVSVQDHLACLAPGAGEAEAHEYVVEAGLEQTQQVLAGHAGLAARLVVVVAELLLEHAVVAARLLLLAQLNPVLRLARAATAVVARRILAPLDAALVGQAALPLQEELHALAAALLALWSGIAGHQTLLRLRGRQPLCACGVTSLMEVISSPAACSERIAVSRPDSGPLTNTSTFCSPCSMPLRAAASAVTCAANGVDLREPLKPAPPADSHAITLPSLSDSDTMVLLKLVLMCAWPNGTFFRTRLRPRGRRRGAGIRYFLPAFFLPATCMRLGPLRVRAFVLVFCPWTGRPRRWRRPR